MYGNLTIKCLTKHGDVWYREHTVYPPVDMDNLPKTIRLEQYVGIFALSAVHPDQGIVEYQEQ